MMDAMLFCNWLSRHEGRKPFYDMSDNRISLRLTDGYRLPSGSEWECACRAGTQTAFPWGRRRPLAERLRGHRPGPRPALRQQAAQCLGLVRHARQFLGADL